MRSTVIAAAVLLAILGTESGVAAKGGGGAVHVKGYYRKDGTYVSPHVRSAPDGNVWNNWSTKGNTNPYTGTVGTVPAGNGYQTHAPAYAPSTATSTATTVRAFQPQGVARPYPRGADPQKGSAPKLAWLEEPSPFSARHAWQLLVAPPFVSILEEFKLAGVLGIVCRALSDCRPTTTEYPRRAGEFFAEQAVFVGAMNRESQRVDIWGYSSRIACENQRNLLGQVLNREYEPPTACTVISMKVPEIEHPESTDN